MDFLLLPGRKKNTHITREIPLIQLKSNSIRRFVFFYRRGAESTIPCIMLKIWCMGPKEIPSLKFSTLLFRYQPTPSDFTPPPYLPQKKQSRTDRRNNYTLILWEFHQSFFFMILFSIPSFSGSETQEKNKETHLTLYRPTQRVRGGKNRFWKMVPQSNRTQQQEKKGKVGVNLCDWAIKG